MLRAQIAVALFFGVAGLLGPSGYFLVRTQSLENDRRHLQSEVRGLQHDLEGANSRSADLDKQLSEKKAQLAQLTGDVTGKDAVIVDLQAGVEDRQKQIDALTRERDTLKGCLDGVTLALMQLSNSGSSTAKSTLEGVSEVCRQADVLLTI